MGKHSTMRPSPAQTKITVLGTIHCEDDNTFECNVLAENFEAEDTVKILGDLEIKDSVEIEDGSLEGHGNMISKEVDVDRPLHVTKDFTATEVEVGGSIRTHKGVFARKVEIGKRGEVEGPISAEESIVGKDAGVKDIFGKNVLLRSGAEAENIHGENITLESHCQVNGNVRYSCMLRMDKGV